VRSSVTDTGRLQALDATGLLAAAPVPSLDRLTALTARLVHADSALVSLVGADRQVFAGSCGAPADLAGGSPLSHSYCRHVVEDAAPVIITDARTDERFRDHPLVLDGIATAYAGFPLRDPAGYVLGSFCVLDSEPRDWTEEELSIVRDLAGAAESEVAAMHDVTERELLFRRQQEQVERLQELDRMKDGLVAVVSNELRHPIGVIRAYTGMLLESTGLTNEDRHNAGVVDRTAALLTRLVEDLLDLARLDAGHITVEPQPISAARLLADAVDARRADAETKQIRITTSFDDHLPLNADPERLRQVLDVLLSNAIRYTPAEGSVTVCAVAAGDQLAISVTDTGIGIPAEQYPKLFSRFFRAGNAVRQSSKGTGLGLAVSKAIVEAHGGTITARPEPGGGTTFAVTLPAGPG
jgi:signal transduction histidine kinase